MHEPVPIEGPRLVLRELTVTDVTEAYCRWLNDAAVTEFLESRFAPQNYDTIAEYVASIGNSPDSILFAMIERRASRHIGNIRLGPIDHNHRYAEIGLLIGERDCWGVGYAREAITLIRDYAFDRLGLHRLTAGCYAPNKGSEIAFLKAGFRVEGRRRHHYLLNGTYVDGVLLGMMKSDRDASP